MVAHADRPARPLAAATRLVGGGRPARAPGASVSPELTLTSTYVAGADLNYARVGNPTWSAFETTLASLEGDASTTALAFASGMGAISAALSLLPHGGRVIAPRHFYNGTSAVLDTWHEAGRAHLTRVDLADDGALDAALAAGCDLVWVESPSNPMLETCDVAAVTRRAHAAGALVIEDNTFNTPLGRRVSGEQMQLVGRYECCARNIMLPMHQRVLADGCTLLIRGQRDSDYAAPPARSGDFAEGLEFLYPVQSWTGDQVEQYLRENGLPIADYYPEGIKRASDCMTCTAWWDDGRAQYLRRFYPEQHKIFIDRAVLVRNAIAKQMQWLNHELEA